MTLAINGTEVLQHQLPSVRKSRHFGFFRYSDKVETRARKILYRGQWPMELPSVANQELAFAEKGVFPVSTTAVSTRNFDLNRTHDELKADGFRMLGPANQIQKTENGLRFETKNATEQAQWPGITRLEKITGDFDVTVDFNDLKFESLEKGWGSGFSLQAELDDAVKSSVAIGIHGDKDKKIFAKASLIHDLATGIRHHDAVKLKGQTESGRLRLVRQGAEMHCLFAAGDDEFQLLQSFLVGDSAVKELRLMNKCTDENAKSDVKAGSFLLNTGGNAKN